MPEPTRPTRPGFWSQAMAILRLATYQARNQFGSNLRGSRKGMRDATANKHDRSLLLPGLFALLLIGIASNTSYQAVHGLAGYARDHWPGERTPEVIEVTGRSRASLWRDMQAGRFPRPVKIGPRSVAWRASWVRAWMDQVSGASSNVE